MTPQEIFEAAERAAQEATEKHIAKYGDEMKGAWGACGFAWVVVRPARGAFIKWCKANDKGSKYWSGGWEFWNPSNYPGQNVDYKAAGAKAFCEVLQKNGLDASWSTRLD